MGNEDMLWSCIAFTGGIAGKQDAPCGALSAGAVCAGMLFRQPMDQKQAAKQARLDARSTAFTIAQGFKDRFGSIACSDLVGYDFSKPEGYRQFLESGVWKEKCDKYVQFVLEKLYEASAKQDQAQQPQLVTIYTTPGCPYCAAAKQDLEERGVKYHEISTDSNPEVLQEINRLSQGSNIVPIIITGDEVKVGFGGG